MHARDTAQGSAPSHSHPTEGEEAQAAHSAPSQPPLPHRSEELRMQDKGTPPGMIAPPPLLHRPAGLGVQDEMGGRGPLIQDTGGMGGEWDQDKERPLCLTMEEATTRRDMDRPARASSVTAHRAFCVAL